MLFVLDHDSHDRAIIHIGELRQRADLEGRTEVYELVFLSGKDGLKKE